MSRRSYGAPRVDAELRLGQGLRLGRKRVARLMRSAGLQGIFHQRKRDRTGPLPAVHDVLVKRAFVADFSDRHWATDVTEHRTSTGRSTAAPPSTPTPAWSWAGRSPTTSAPSSSSTRCRWRPGGAVRNPAPWSTVTAPSVYSSWAFGHRLRAAGLLGSMGRVASSVDTPRSKASGQRSSASCSTPDPWIAPSSCPPRYSSGSRVGTTPNRRHTSLGMLSPAQFEAQKRPAATAA